MGMYAAPQAPDPAATAQTQFNYDTGASIGSGIINNPNIRSPYGNVSYTSAGTESITLPDGTKVQVPRYNQNVQLGKAEQTQKNQRDALMSQLLGRANATAPNVGGYQTGYQTNDLNTNFKTGPDSIGFMGVNRPGARDLRENTASTAFGGPANLGTSMGTKAFTQGQDLLTNVATDRFQRGQQLTGNTNSQAFDTPDSFTEDRKRVEEAMMARSGTLLSQNRDGEVARLAAMGLAPGGENYGRVADQFERSANDLALGAVLAGGQEQSRMLGESRAFTGAENDRNLTDATFLNQARQGNYAMNADQTARENARRMEGAAFTNAARQGNYAMDTDFRANENARVGGEAAFRNEALANIFNMGQTSTANNNQRKLNDATFSNQAQQQEFAMEQAQSQLRMSQIQMENARRTGDIAAFNAALQARNAAQQQMTVNNRDSATFGNSTRQQMINELLGIMGGAQIGSPGQPNYQGQAISAPDFTGMVNQNYQNQVGAYNSNMQGLSGLLSAGLGFLPGAA